MARFAQARVPFLPSAELTQEDDDNRARASIQMVRREVQEAAELQRSPASGLAGRFRSRRCAVHGKSYVGESVHAVAPGLLSCHPNADDVCRMSNRKLPPWVGSLLRSGWEHECVEPLSKAKRDHHFLLAHTDKQKALCWVPQKECFCRQQS